MIGFVHECRRAAVHHGLIVPDDEFAWLPAMAIHAFSGCRYGKRLLQQFFSSFRVDSIKSKWIGIQVKQFTPGNRARNIDVVGYYISRDD